MAHPSNRVKKICGQCGRQFDVAASRIKYGRGKHCSSRCQYSSIKSRIKLGKIKRSCLNCSMDFFVYKSKLKSHIGSGKYCSRFCRDTHRIGVNHPQYLNGSSTEHRGANWQSQRRKTKIRDHGRCRTCGITDKKSVMIYGQALHVHHKMPFRFFSDYRQANRLNNLLTLCPADHRRMDGLSV